MLVVAFLIVWPGNRTEFQQSCVKLIGWNHKLSHPTFQEWKDILAHRAERHMVGAHESCLWVRGAHDRDERQKRVAVSEQNKPWGSSTAWKTCQFGQLEYQLYSRGVLPMCLVETYRKMHRVTSLCSVGLPASGLEHSVVWNDRQFGWKLVFSVVENSSQEESV